MASSRSEGRHPGDCRGRDDGALRVRSFSGPSGGDEGAGEIRGIGIPGGSQGGTAPRPRITAFIWAEREECRPTLPFGRWKAAS